MDKYFLNTPLYTCSYLNSPLFLVTFVLKIFFIYKHS
jgi:hypothetical protein